MARLVLIRPHLQSFAYDEQLFGRLCAQLGTGALGPDRCRLSERPSPLPARSDRVCELRELSSASRTEFEERGRAAMAAGQLGVLILAGGMATRFGGGAKGCFALRGTGPTPSFLSLKLQQIARCSGEVAVLVMDSFATHQAVGAHLEEISWMGLAPSRCHRFSQSLLPRVDPDTHQAFALAADATAWSDAALYCAPGHGDTLVRLRDSEVLQTLREQGVTQLLVSNVDNLLAGVDPVLLGAHLRGVQSGIQVSVESVPRRRGEAGGCVAWLERGPAIVESFRLPAQTVLDDYADFNTNTLWIDLRALDPLPALQWHPVLRQVQPPSGPPRPCLQFEQLIGELTEHRPTQVLRVARDERFAPIKRREDLDDARATIDRLIASEAGSS